MSPVMPTAGAIGGALTLRTVITLANAQFKAAIGEVKAEVTGAAATMKRASGMFLLGAAIIGAALAGAARAASTFEQSLANMDSVAKTTRAEFAMLRDQALQLGTTSIYAASEVADAMYWLASAGQRAAEIGATLPGVLTLAAATGHDLADTTETVVSVLASFQYQAGQTMRVVNSMAATIGNSLANMDKMSESLKFAAPVAKAANQEIEDLNATLGLFFNAGLQGSMAGTAYRRVILALLAPNKALQERVALVGGEIEKLDPRMHKLADVIDYLNDLMLDAGDIAQGFGLRGATAMLYLMDVGGDALREMIKKVTATTEAQDMMRRQMDTVQSQMKVLKNAITGVGIVLGEKLLPYVREVVAWGIRTAQSLAGMSEKSLDLTIKLSGLTLGLMGVMSLIGRMAPMLGAATGPLAAIALGLYGAYAAGIWATGAIDEFVRSLNDMGVAAIENMSLLTKLAFEISILQDPETWKDFATSQVEAWKLMFKWIEDPLKITKEQIGSAFEGVLEMSGVRAFQRGISRELDQAMERLKKTGDAATDMAQRMIDAFEATSKEAKLNNVLWQAAQAEVQNYVDMAARQAERSWFMNAKATEGYKERQRAITEMWQAYLRGQKEVVTSKDPGFNVLTGERWSTKLIQNIDKVLAKHNELVEELREAARAAESTGRQLATVAATMGDVLLEYLETGKTIINSMLAAFGEGVVQMIGMVVQEAVTRIMIQAAETAGLLSISGFFNPANWLKIAPALAASAAAIAAVRALGKITFHEGGKPPREGWYKVMSNETVIDPNKARRGGYGSTYGDALGMRESVTVQIGNVTVTDPNVDIDVLVHKLGRRLRRELARGGA